MSSVRAAVGVALAASVFLSVAACDQGKQRDQRTTGPFVRLLATNLRPDLTLPADEPIELSFDRFLLPATVVRQSFILVDANNVPLQGTRVTYDPVTRVVRLTPAADAALVPGQPYKVILPVPEGDTDEGGVRAIDRATLEAAQVVGFQVSNPSPAPQVEPPRMSFCREILPVFKTRCTNGPCHASEVGIAGRGRAMGLVLDTPAGVRATALGRAAQEGNFGPLAGPGRAPRRRFGADMPLIEPGNPGNSWLLYKVLLATQPAEPHSSIGGCDGQLNVLTPDPPRVTFLPLTEAERERLSDFVIGSPMPYPSQPGNDVRTNNLDANERARLSRWITEGAVVDECGECAGAPLPVPTDGGS